MSKKHNLLAQMQHANLKDGEFVFRWEGEWIHGHMTNLKTEWASQLQCINVQLEGIVPLDKLA